MLKREIELVDGAMLYLNIKMANIKSDIHLPSIARLVQSFNRSTQPALIQNPLDYREVYTKNQEIQEKLAYFFDALDCLVLQEAHHSHINRFSFQMSSNVNMALDWERDIYKNGTCSSHTRYVGRFVYPPDWVSIPGSASYHLHLFQLKNYFDKEN
jgi:hypothetical protein